LVRYYFFWQYFLVHGYFEVAADEIQNVVEKDLLPLKVQIESYLKEENQ